MCISLTNVTATHRQDNIILTPGNCHADSYEMPTKEASATKHLDQVKIKEDGLNSSPQEVGQQKVVE